MDYTIVSADEFDLIRKLTKLSSSREKQIGYEHSPPETKTPPDSPGDHYRDDHTLLQPGFYLPLCEPPHPNGCNTKPGDLTYRDLGSPALSHTRSGHPHPLPDLYANPDRDRDPDTHRFLHPLPHTHGYRYTH